MVAYRGDLSDGFLLKVKALRNALNLMLRQGLRSSLLGAAVQLRSTCAGRRRVQFK
jgi:hypothetical protein